jgi:hypothetical protein
LDGDKFWHCDISEVPSAVHIRFSSSALNSFLLFVGKTYVRKIKYMYKIYVTWKKTSVLEKYSLAEIWLIMKYNLFKGEMQQEIFAYRAS